MRKGQGGGHIGLLGRDLRLCVLYPSVRSVNFDYARRCLALNAWITHLFSVTLFLDMPKDGDDRSN